MCLIIFTPNVARATIRRAILQRGFEKNSDGAGIAFILDGKVRVSKPYFTFDEFFPDYQRIRALIRNSTNPNSPLLIHFRWGTCGSNNRTNTQPITIYRNRLVMAHNGVFPSLSGQPGDISDSVALARLINQLGWSFPFTKPERNLLKGLCGDVSNKLVFLNADGRHLIVNEQLGTWREGSWYSDKAEVYRPDFCTFRTRRRRWGKGTDDLEEGMLNDFARYSREEGPPDDDDWRLHHVASAFHRPNPPSAPQKTPNTPRWVHGEGYDATHKL